MRQTRKSSDPRQVAEAAFKAATTKPSEPGLKKHPSLTRGKPAPAPRSASQELGNGNDGTGHGSSVTAPLPKKAIDYQLTESISLDEAQALLARKLEEARVIIRELEKRSGLRLTLNRNFQIVVDLSGR